MNSNTGFRWKTGIVTVLSLFLMGYIDYATGYELIFSAAYLVPVALCAWNFGRNAIVLMSLAGGVASWLADFLHPYSSPLILYLNSFTCFTICLITGLILRRLKRTLQEREEMNRDLQKALEDLKASTEEIRKLQDGLQVVCAWTKQLKVGEQWMTPEEFLRTKLHLHISHGMSPEGEKSFVEDQKILERE